MQSVDMNQKVTASVLDPKELIFKTFRPCSLSFKAKLPLQVKCDPSAAPSEILDRDCFPAHGQMFRDQIK